MCVLSIVHINIISLLFCCWKLFEENFSKNKKKVLKYRHLFKLILNMCLSNLKDWFNRWFNRWFIRWFKQNDVFYNHLMQIIKIGHIKLSFKLLFNLVDLFSKKATHFRASKVLIDTELWIIKVLLNFFEK